MHSLYLFIFKDLTARGDENVPQRELERRTMADQNISLKHKLDVSIVNFLYLQLGRDLEGI